MRAVGSQWDLCLGLDDEPSGRLCVRISTQTEAGNTAVHLLQIGWRGSRWGLCPSHKRKKPHICKPWSSWGTLTTSLSAGGTIQQGTSNPGSLWNTLMTTSSQRWPRNPWGRCSDGPHTYKPEMPARSRLQIDLCDVDFCLLGLNIRFMSLGHSKSVSSN